MQVTRNHLQSHPETVRSSSDRMRDLERLTGIFLSPEYIPHVHRMKAVERICIKGDHLPALRRLPSPEILSTLSLSRVGSRGFDVTRFSLYELQLDNSYLSKNINLPASLKSLVMYQCTIGPSDAFAAVIRSSSIDSITLYNSNLPLEVAQALGSLASLKRIQLFSVPLIEGALEALLSAPHLEELIPGEHSSSAVKLLANRTNSSALKQLHLRERAGIYEASDLAAIKTNNPGIEMSHSK